MLKNRKILAVIVFLVFIIALWFGISIWSGVQEAEDLTAYAQEMEAAGETMEQAGTTLEALAAGDPFAWSAQERQQWQVLLQTVAQTRADVDGISVPSFLAEAHVQIEEALATYDGALTDLDAILAKGAAQATEEELNAVIGRIDAANTQIDSYMRDVEEVLNERYGE